MTVTAPVALHARSIREVVESREAVAVAALGGLWAFLAVATWLTWGDIGLDTGYDPAAGARVAGGELPYVDFTYYYGPLAPFLLGLAGLAFGGGFAPVIALGLALAAGIVAATYALARTHAGPGGAFLAAALVMPLAFAPNNLSFVLPHSFSVTLGVLGALLFLLGAGRYASTGERSLLVGAGFAAGMVTLTRPEFAVAVLVAAAAWLALRIGRRVGRPRELALFAVPALGLPTIVYGAFALAVSPRELVFENLYPVDELEAGGNALLRIHAPLTAGSFADVASKAVLYALGVAVLLGLAALLTRSARWTLSVRAGAAIGVAVAALAFAARSETLRWGLEFVYGGIPVLALVALIVLVTRQLRSPEGFRPESQRTLLVVAVLAVLAAKTYAAFFFFAPSAQYAVYAAPFVAVCLVALHLRRLVRNDMAMAVGAAWLAFLVTAGITLTIKDARRESVAVRGVGGTIAETPANASTYQAALDEIAARTDPGEPILLAPQLTALYVLSGRENPLRQVGLLPTALPTVRDEREAIRSLDRARVRLAVIDRRTFPEYGHSAFGGSFQRELSRWVTSEFDRTRVLGRPPGRVLEIWTRGTP